MKAILNLPFQSTAGSYLQSVRQALVYFSPILKNYIRNDTAMDDCLSALEVGKLSIPIDNLFISQRLLFIAILGSGHNK